jgi:cytochrome d ubiquinol oxidase subunit II
MALWSALPTGVLGVASFLLAPRINPPLLTNYEAQPSLYLVVALAAGAFVATALLAVLGRDLGAFGASGLLIVGAVASIAVALYPNLLPATPDPRYSLTIYNASASPYGLTVALVWFVVGLALIGVYTLVTHRPFVGRVRAGSEEY